MDIKNIIESMIEEKLLEKARQLKDPKTELMVVKDGKVIVIDKTDLKKYEKMGYSLAEEVDEARNPQFVINKFMKDKKDIEDQRQKRGEQLRKDRDAQLAKDKQSVNEAVAKIACLKCDEVSTAAAWKKNGGFCPKCKVSSQCVAEGVDLSEDVHNDLHDLLIKFERDLFKYMNPKSGVDAQVRTEIGKAASIIERTRQDRLFKVRPGR